jgi:hypothetical protein
LLNDGDGVTGVNESRVLESDLVAVSAALSRLGYNTGAYQGLLNTNSNKGIIKLDWNINDNKFAVIYNFECCKRQTSSSNCFRFRGPDANTFNLKNQDIKLTTN